MDEYNSLDEDKKKDFDMSKLGENIKFYGYNDMNGNLDLSQAFTNSSFIFDGVDDYVELPYNNSNGFENGFTFEFYGQIRSIGKRLDHGDMKDKDLGSDGEYTCGLMHIYGPNDKDDNFWGARFGCICRENHIDMIYFTLCPASSGWVRSNVDKKGWSDDTSKWMQYADLSNDFKKDLYFTIVYDAMNNVEVLYRDGYEVKKDEIDRLYWDCFLEHIDKTGKMLSIGRVAESNYENWLYSDFECYSMKVYRRALNETEVLKNYNASVDYHNYLVQNVK